MLKVSPACEDSITDLSKNEKVKIFKHFHLVKPSYIVNPSYSPKHAKKKSFSLLSASNILLINQNHTTTSTKTPTNFYLIIAYSFLLVQAVLGADPLFHICSSSSGNFTGNSPYEANLKKLTSFLYLKTPLLGFGLGSIGQYQDQVHGLAQCRVDLSASNCKLCVADAGTEIRKRCPLNKGAIIWYDNCLFKYSAEDFFGKIDTQNAFYMSNLNKVNNSVEFNQKTKDLLTQLRDEAYETPRLYAAGESELNKSTKLYGLVQCTRDLSSSDCEECVDNAIGQLPSCCDGKQGGRVVGGSCSIGYEIYPFVNA